MNRCLGPLPELPVVEALSFLDLTESDRFLAETLVASVKRKWNCMRQKSLSLGGKYLHGRACLGSQVVDNVLHCTLHWWLVWGMVLRQSQHSNMSISSNV